MLPTAVILTLQNTINVCKTCTNCRKNHALSGAAIQARAKQDQKESNKDYVHQQLINMREQYAVCKLSTCDGRIAKCLDKDSGHYYCYSCHAYSCDENYHQNCIARKIINQSCPFCFLALDKDIQQSSTRDEHRVGHCISKIKSNVFLFIKFQIYRIKENLHESYWKVS